MKLYEILFIVHPNYEEARLTKVVDNVKEKITNNGGTIIDVSEMGKKKLAYKIENHRYGNYILIHFESEPQFISEFKKWLKIQTQILAKIIVRIEKKDLENDVQKENIEEKKVVSENVEVEEKIQENEDIQDESAEENEVAK